MSVIYVLIVISLTIAAVFLSAFLWAVRNGQFDDVHTPAIRMLFKGISNQLPDEQRRRSRGVKGD